MFYTLKFQMPNYTRSCKFLDHLVSQGSATSQVRCGGSVYTVLKPENSAPQCNQNC